MSPRLHDRLEVLRDDLLAGCFSKAQATRRLEAVLEQSGETDFVIRTDGPAAAPLERFNEIMRMWAADSSHESSPLRNRRCLEGDPQY